MGADPTGKRGWQKLMSSRGRFARCPGASVRSQQETIPGQDGGEVWGDRCVPACHAGAAELPHVGGMRDGYAPYARACLGVI